MMKYFQLLFLTIAISAIHACSSDNDAISLSSLGNGQGGSLARIAVYNSHVYVVDNSNLKTYSLDNGILTLQDNDGLNFGVETIFPYGDNLFIGSVDAMYIFNISNLNNPEFKGQFNHSVACDPVVVESNYAYVSLRISSPCNSNATRDVVEILDVTDINSPILLTTFSDVDTPFGLGIKNDVLYLCQSTNGLLIIDVSDKLNPSVIQKIDVNAYDVIVSNNLLLLIGDQGFIQYDITSPENPKELGSILVE